MLIAYRCSDKSHGLGCQRGHGYLQPVLWPVCAFQKASPLKKQPRRKLSTGIGQCNCSGSFPLCLVLLLPPPPPPPVSLMSIEHSGTLVTAFAFKLICDGQFVFWFCFYIRYYSVLVSGVSPLLFFRLTTVRLVWCTHVTQASLLPTATVPFLLPDYPWITRRRNCTRSSSGQDLWRKTSGGMRTSASRCKISFRSVGASRPPISSCSSSSEAG